MRLFRERRSGTERRRTDRPGGRRALERERDELHARFMAAETRHEWEPLHAELLAVRARIDLLNAEALRRSGLAA